MEEKYTTNVIEIKPDKKYLFIIEHPEYLDQGEKEHMHLEFKVMQAEQGLAGSLMIFDRGAKTKILEMDKALKEEVDWDHALPEEKYEITGHPDK